MWLLSRVLCNKYLNKVIAYLLDIVYTLLSKIQKDILEIQN